MGRPISKRYYQNGSTVTTTTLIMNVANSNGSGTYSSNIIKQAGSKKYKVTPDIGGSGVAYLVPDETPAVGKGYITATDYTGATYLVKKLTQHRATIVRWTEAVGGGSPPSTGWVFITDTSVPWTTTTPAPAGMVTIESA